MNRVEKRTVWVVTLGLLALLPAAAGGVVVGKKAGKVQGRWLDVGQPADLSAYDAVAVGQVTSEIHWKKAGKEQPIDEQILAGKIQEHLGLRLREAMLFRQVLAAPPPPGTAGVLRLDCDLQIEPGSRALRYTVGFGAGKSKSVLEILLRDHASGREIGRYHGYGTGSGMGFKMVGGGARKMTQDDIQENAKVFVELLAQLMPASPAGTALQTPAAATPAPVTPVAQPAAPQEAALVLHSVELAPEIVTPGGKLDIAIDLTLSDPGLSVGKVALSLSYAIQRGAETVFASSPKEVAVSVNERTEMSVKVATGSEPGLYTLVVTVSYGSLQKAGAGTFTIG